MSEDTYTLIVDNKIHVSESLDEIRAACIDITDEQFVALVERNAKCKVLYQAGHWIAVPR